MNPNWIGVASAILALAAFFIVRDIARGWPAKRQILSALLAIVMAVPGTSFAVYYLHLFPEPDWYFQFRSVRGTEFFMVLIGIAGGLVATLLPQLLFVLPLLIVVVLVMAPVIKPFIGPIPDGTMRDMWHGNVCLQSTPSTCGAASTATILKQLGVDVAESELAAEAHSYAGGTEAWYLARAVRMRGLKADFIFAPGFAPEKGLPAVVGVRFAATGHFISVLGQEGDHFIVGDPLRGRELLSREQLEKRYVFSGFHMRISPRS